MSISPHNYSITYKKHCSHCKAFEYVDMFETCEVCSKEMCPKCGNEYGSSECLLYLHNICSDTISTCPKCYESIMGD